MRYLSVCSGIEAASVAWHPIGWEPAAFAEIEAFPSAVLKHHYPSVPNLGDITKFKEWPSAQDLGGAIDLVCGGTPCQSFSVAGLRQGLADPRGNLALTFLAIVDRYRPRWVLWENVPGVLSDDGGRSFGSILGGLGKLGYGWAYRVLDAQYCRVDGLERAVPQRRRRVFVVGCLGDWRCAAAVLFEPQGVLGDTAPRRQAGQGVAPSLTVGAHGSSGHQYRQKGNEDALIADALRARTPRADRGDEAANLVYIPDIVSQAMSSKWSKQSSGPAGDEVAHLVAHSLNGNSGRQQVESTYVAQAVDLRNGVIDGDVSMTIQSGGLHGERGLSINSIPHVAHSLRADGFDAGEDGTGRGTPLVPIAFDARQSDVIQYGDKTGPLDTDGHTMAVAYGIRSDALRDGVALTPSADAEGRVRLRNPGMGVYEQLAPTVDASQPHAVAFDMRGRVGGAQFEGPHDTANIRAASGGSSKSYVAQQWAVRRLTPLECERLMGLPDGYTDIAYRGKPAADGPRYKALGNSMAVNCMRWIGRRIEMVEELMDELGRRGG